MLYYYQFIIEGHKEYFCDLISQLNKKCEEIKNEGSKFTSFELPEHVRSNVIVFYFYYESSLP